MSSVSAAVVSVRDEGLGHDYMSGEPIKLPAASLSTNLFHNGVRVIRNRLHTVRPAVFDTTGRLDHMTRESDAVMTRAWSNGTTNLPLLRNGAPLERQAFNAASDGQTAAPLDSRFPAYLKGQQYIWFSQEVRHYTNYSCTVTVDCPSTFYLLVDNRVNDYLPDSEYDDPRFGPPDTEWVSRDGWKRVNTGLFPNGAGDYLAIDEGDNGTLNQAYAIYSRTLTHSGSVTLRTQFEGNIYCLVVATNSLPITGPAK